MRIYCFLLSAIMPLLMIGSNVRDEKPISSDLFGIFIEDLNYTADGGLYAEMVQNRSFEYSPSDVTCTSITRKGSGIRLLPGSF